MPLSPLRVKFAFEMGLQILSGLKVLHESGFVKFNISPETISVTEAINSKANQFYFTLQNFGDIQRVKLENLLLRKKEFSGDTDFASIRALRQQ